MAWETRRNNKSYYYHKRRVNGHVVSEYVGRGETAELLARAYTLLEAEEENQRAQSRAVRAELADIEQAVQEIDTLVNMLAQAALLASGCSTHKGQWRLKRAKTTVADRNPAGDR